MRTTSSHHARFRFRSPLALALSLTGLLTAPAQEADDAAASLAEPPHWPIGMVFPEGVVTTRRPPQRAQAMAWTPPGEEPIRALLIVPANTDSLHFAEHAPLREVAAKHRMAIVYWRNPVHYPMIDGDDLEGNQRALNALADHTGIEAFRHAPYITFGKSSVSRYPFWMPWAEPDRVIAGICYQGEVPWWPLRDWARPQTRTIPYVVVNGEHEWSNTWYRHVRPNLLNYRLHTAWLPHQVVVAGVGHGNYPDAHGSPGWGQPVAPGQVSVLKVWDYLATFVDKVLTLRLPEEGVPTEGPIALRDIDPDDGVLIHPRAVEEYLEVRWRPLRFDDGRYRIVDHEREPGQVFDENPGTVERERLVRPAREVPEDERRHHMWVPDRELAEAWIRLHTVRARAAGEE